VRQPLVDELRAERLTAAVDFAQFPAVFVLVTQAGLETEGAGIQKRL
jgi:hypothetical protein